MQSKDLPVKTGGIKHDHGKPRPDLILHTMARAMLAVSEVAAFGASKYDDDNWLLVDDAKKRYADAKARHMLQGAIESHDEESGLLHAAHEAWNALALLELKLRERKRAPLLHNWTAEADERIDVIGQNGNEGEHYREALIGRRTGGGIIIGFEGDDAIVMDSTPRDCMSWHEAIKFCEELFLGEHNDWRLPTKDQLNLAWVSREKLDDLNLDDDWYWSSSLQSTSSAWAQTFGNGFQNNPSKSAFYKVRPVRSVKIENLEFEDSEAAIVAHPPGDE